MNKKQFNKSKHVLHFKKWSRASYAVFTTVSREVSIRVLSLACLTAIGVVQVVAQTETVPVENEKIDLDELVVSADAVPQLQSEISRVVTVINKKDILASGASSISDLLECVLNVDVRQRGLHGVQSDISIRGGSFDQIMVLMNGINISDPQTGHHNMNIPLNLNAVERIEVLNGPGARHLGANAFSGAINIITNETAERQVSASLSAGSYGYLDGSINANFKLGGISSFVSFGEKVSDGYIDNTDFESVNFFYHAATEVADSKIDFQFGYQDKKFGSNSFYTPLYPEQYELTKTTFTTLKFTRGKKLRYTPSIYYRQNNDRFELFREDRYRKQGNVFVNHTDTARYLGSTYNYPGHNYHQTEVFGTNINATYYWDNIGKTSFGSELRSEKVLSNSLKATDLLDPVPVRNADASYTKSFSRANQSIFIEHVYNHPLFNIGLGVMGNYNTSLNTGLDFYPGVDFNVKIYNGLTAKFSSNKSLRLPSFTDLFYNGPENEGNIGLKPETAISYEGGLKYSSKGLDAHATVFRRDGKNLIDWVKADGDSKWHTDNLLEMTTYGTEFYAKVLPDFLFEVRLPVQSITLSASTLNSKKESGDYMSKYVMDYLKLKASASATFFYKHLFLNIEYTYQERAGGYELFVNKESQGDVAYKPFGLVNAKLWYEFSRGRIFVESSNLLDEDYVDIGNVVQPGTWLRGGINLKLGF